MQKLREKEVQSVDQEVEKTDSVVIERFDISSKMESNEAENNKNKNMFEIDMSHSRSQNVLDNHRSILESDTEDIEIPDVFPHEDKTEELKQKEAVAEKEKEKASLWINPAPKQVQSMENINSEDIPTSPIQNQHFSNQFEV